MYVKSCENKYSFIGLSVNKHTPGYTVSVTKPFISDQLIE